MLYLLMFHYFSYFIIIIIYFLGPFNLPDLVFYIYPLKRFKMQSEKVHYK